MCCLGPLRGTSQHCEQLLALLFAKRRCGCDDLGDDSIIAKGTVNEIACTGNESIKVCTAVFDRPSIFNEGRFLAIGTALL